MKHRVMGSHGCLFVPIIAKLGLFVTCLIIGMAVITPVSSAEPRSEMGLTGLRTVATIRPIYSLLAALTKGVSQPVLLIKHQASPHHYNLRPSEKRLLNSADLIFWIGPELETFLPNILATTPKQHHAIRLDESPDLLRLSIRTGKAWEEEVYEGDEDDEHAHHHHHHHHALDPHIWLSPDNAEKISAHMARTLIHYDPEHRTQYEQNLKKLSLRLKALDTEIKERLKNAQHAPFLVFHDGYQYFEHAYGLKGVGAISLNPELPMSSRRLEQVQEKIQHLGVRCLFSEPQWGTHLVDVLAHKYKIKVGMLDPLGAATPDPVNDYFVNLQALAKTVETCLSKESH